MATWWRTVMRVSRAVAGEGLSKCLDEGAVKVQNNENRGFQVSEKTGRTDGETRVGGSTPSGRAVSNSVESLGSDPLRSAVEGEKCNQGAADARSAEGCDHTKSARCAVPGGCAEVRDLRARGFGQFTDYTDVAGRTGAAPTAGAGSREATSLPPADPRNSPTWCPCSCGGSREEGHRTTCRKYEAPAPQCDRAAEQQIAAHAMAARSRKERDRQWRELGERLREGYAITDRAFDGVNAALKQSEQLHHEQMIAALGQVEAALSAGFAAVVTDEEIEAAGILATLLTCSEPPNLQRDDIRAAEWEVYVNARAEARAWLVDYAKRHAVGR